MFSEVSLGDLALCVLALSVAYLVFRLGSLIGKAGKILEETQASLHTTTENLQPTLVQLTDTVARTNDQLARVDAITSNVGAMATNANALTGLVAATLGRPLVKVASLTYGVRSALTGASGSRVATVQRAMNTRERDLRDALGMDLTAAQPPAAAGAEPLTAHQARELLRDPAGPTPPPASGEVTPPRTAGEGTSPRAAD